MEIVDCSKHGKQHIVLSCQHLSSDSHQEVFYVPENEDQEATVWCSTCEKARIKDKGWYDHADSIASWQLICTLCLKDIINSATTCHTIDAVRTPEDKAHNKLLQRIKKSFAFFSR